MSTSITTHDVNEISEASFSEGWARVTGYRPAAVLDDRRAMIAMLMEEVAVLPVFPPRAGMPCLRRAAPNSGTVASGETGFLLAPPVLPLPAIDRLTLRAVNDPSGQDHA